MNKIYIPTFRRVNTQITFDNLPDKYKEQVIMVVQEQEKEHYNYDCEYLVVGNNIGLAQTKKEIIYHADKSRFCLYDDDIIFYRRNVKYSGLESDMEKSKRQMNEEDFDEMFGLFNSWMDDENIIVIGHRGATLPPSGKLFQDITDTYSCFMINGTEVFKFRDEIDWTYVQVGEDVLMLLEFFLHGYKNRRSDIFCRKRLEWQEGGCNEYRNAELHNKDHEKLIEKYPKYVNVGSKKIKEIKNVGALNYYNYRWKQAYNSFFE